MLSELSSFMQSCLTTDEIYSTFGQFARRLFPGRRGAFYRLHPSRDWLDAAMTWEGDTASAQALPPAFAPDDCWALRRGRAYRLEAAGAALPCAHVEAASGGCEPRPYVCIPLLAHGEALGSLYVESGEAALLQFGEAVADHLALALANMRLRESLAKK